MVFTRNMLGKRKRDDTPEVGMESRRVPALAEDKQVNGKAEEVDGCTETTSSPSDRIPAQNPTPSPDPSSPSATQEAREDQQDDADVSSPEKPTSIFPFMQLPAELRIHVYHMALTRDEPLNMHLVRALEKPSERDDSPSPGSPKPELLAPPTVYFQPITITPQTQRARNAAIEANTSLPPSRDPIITTILRLNKQINKEARQMLYSDNTFNLNLISGVHTLTSLHQRSRSLIKHVILTIPSHHDILDGFADLVRLGLRYCWGLKSFKIILQASLPDDGRVSGATSVYANAFHILRWLPKGCSVVLEGNVSAAVERVVKEEGRLQNVLDETTYLRRQHQMHERH